MIYQKPTGAGALLLGRDNLALGDRQYTLPSEGEPLSVYCLPHLLAGSYSQPDYTPHELEGVSLFSITGQQRYQKFLSHKKPFGLDVLPLENTKGCLFAS